MTETTDPIKLRRRKASRENGKKGGVKTDVGKAVSSQNALKHGVLSNKVKLKGYDSVNHQALYDTLEEEFDAKTLHQKMLVEQLVLCYIKLARCSRFEAEIMNETLKTTDNPNHIGDLFPEKITPKDARALIDESTFKRMELVLTKYEPQLINRMIGLVNVLKKNQ